MNLSISLILKANVLPVQSVLVLHRQMMVLMKIMKMIKGMVVMEEVKMKDDCGDRVMKMTGNVVVVEK